MAGVRRILKHVEVDVAHGARRCRRNKDHTIAAGEMCLAIREDGLPYSKSYCKECALPILKQAAADLRGIRDAMFPELRKPDSPVPQRDLGTTLVVANRQRQQAASLNHPPMRIEVYEATRSEAVGVMPLPRRRTRKSTA